MLVTFRAIPYKAGNFLMVAVFGLALLLAACGPRENTIRVSSELTESIFLDQVVAPNITPVYVNVRSSSSKVRSAQLSSQVAATLLARDFQLVRDPSKAQVIIDVAVRRVTFDPKGLPPTNREYHQNRSRQLVGSALAGAAIGGLIGGLAGNGSDDIARGIAIGGGAGLGLAGNSKLTPGHSAYSDSYWVQTDVLVSERVSGDYQEFSEKVNSRTRSGSGLNRTTEVSTNRPNYLRHQTSIISQVSAYDLDDPDVLDVLIEDLGHSVAGLI